MMLEKYYEFKQYIDENKRRSVFTYKKINNGLNGPFSVVSFHYFRNIDLLEITKLPPYYKELRGIVYVLKDDKPIDYFLSIGKFWTLNQMESVSLERIGDKKIMKVFEKRDGSLIIPYIVDGEVYFKTFRSFSNNVLDNMYNEIDNLDEIKELVKELHNNGYDILFEYTSMNNRIVVKYFKPSLDVIQIRNRKTLEYMDLNKFSDILNKYRVNVTKYYNYSDKNMTLNEFYDRLNNDKSFELYDLWNSNNFEGFVVQLDDGEMIKVKTKWYFENHGLFDLNSMFVFKEYKQIIKIILDERLDEIDYDIVERNKDIVEKINNYIIYHFNEFRNEIFKFLELKQKVNDIREIVNDIKQSKFNYYIFKCLNSKIPCDESRVWELFKENFFRMVKNGIIPMFEE